jgi:hypothetical protein
MRNVHARNMVVTLHFLLKINIACNAPSMFSYFYESVANVRALLVMIHRNEDVLDSMSNCSISFCRIDSSTVVE